jgi:hypothetical protein
LVLLFDCSLLNLFNVTNVYSLIGYFIRCLKASRSDAMNGCLEILRMAAERIGLHNGFLERTERRASEAPAGLPQAGRRSAEKTGAGCQAKEKALKRAVISHMRSCLCLCLILADTPGVLPVHH